jgi:antirestriction protein ArdC
VSITATNDKAATLAASALTRLSEALASGNSEALTRYLDVMSRFHRYSFHNCLLILCQRPEATQVAGFNRWKELGRWVKKGEKGIAILAPSMRRPRPDELSEDEDTDRKDAPKIVTRFVTVYVFDAEQTEGEPLPTLGKTSGQVGCYLTRLRDLVLEKHIGLAYADNLGGALGLSHGEAITILRGLEPAEELSVLAHELAHELLHRGPRRIETTRQIRELEAEAVAYVVTQACGLENRTASWDYIRLYGGDEKLLSQSLAHIQRSAADIIDYLL